MEPSWVLALRKPGLSLCWSVKLQAWANLEIALFLRRVPLRSHEFKPLKIERQMLYLSTLFSSRAARRHFEIMVLAGAFAMVNTNFAHAQLVPSVSAGAAPAEDAMERAKRQADNVMRWIKVHGDKAKGTPAPVAPIAPVAPGASAVAAKAAPAPKPNAESAPPAATKVAVQDSPQSPTKTLAAARATTSAATAPSTPSPAAPEVPEPAPTSLPQPMAAPPLVPAPDAVAQAPEPDDEDTPLTAISQAKPVIPRALLATLNNGKVMVRFTVEGSGAVSNAEVLSSSNRQLNRPTLNAVSTWRFEPIKTARVAQIEFDFSQ